MSKIQTDKQFQVLHSLVPSALMFYGQISPRRTSKPVKAQGMMLSIAYN